MKFRREEAWIALGIFAMFATAFIVYWPAMHGGFIWDDRLNITGNPVMFSRHGLLDIWLAREGAFDYYPLTWTTWWLEWHTWRKNPFPYHVLNVLLHAGAAAMLWRVLVRLGIPGAFFAAMVFLVHPVNVESVAWISERKNTLSMLLTAISVALFLDWNRTANRTRYWGSVVLFCLALLSKPSVVLLPGVLLLILWWQRGIVRWPDVWRLVPFGILTAIISVVTIFVHHVRGIETGVVRPEGFWSRLAGMGWCVWFYLGKLLWPADLAFIYPRWNIDPTAWRHWIPLVALVAALGVLFAMRRSIGRGPVVAMAAYVALLLPVLGFVDVYFFRYSFVADHWQYPACAAVFACVAAGVGNVVRKLPPVGRSVGIAIACLVIASLSVLAWREAHHYKDEGTLWAAAAKANPNHAMAMNNYASTYLWPQKRFDEARQTYVRAIELDPTFCEAYLSMGATYQREGKMHEAIAWYTKALAVPAGERDPRIVLGDAHAGLGDARTALHWYEQALARSKRVLPYWETLPRLYESVGNVPKAIERYRANAQANPDEAEPWFALGQAFLRHGQPDQAREAMSMARDRAATHAELNGMGLRLNAVGRFESAAEMFREAVRCQPDFGPGFNNLGRAFEGAGRLEDAAEAYEEALRVQPGFREARTNLDRVTSRLSTTRSTGKSGN